MAGLSSIKLISNRFKNILVATAFVATQLITPLMLSGTAAAASISQFNQYDNVGGDWQNGNLQADLFEGDSVPFRAYLDDLTPNTTHTLQIAYDNVDSNTHAYDYLTSYDRTFSPNPCDSVIAGCVTGTPGSIPTDPTLPISQVAGEVDIFAAVGDTASVNSVTYASTPGHSLAGANKQTVVNIEFTTDGSEVVLAWGGHIAQESIWGVGTGASAISGSPYHMRIGDDGLDGQGGSQDRSMKASSVTLYPRITITKVVGGDGSAQPSDFSFNISPSVNGQGTYYIAPGENSVTIFDVQPDGDYEITENEVPGYSFTNGTGTNCIFDGDMATATVAAGTAGEVQHASCTFTNTFQNPTLTLVKKVTNDNGGNQQADQWTLTAQHDQDGAVIDEEGVLDPGSTIASSSATTNTATVAAGVAYDLSESGPDGYEVSADWSCDGGSLSNGAITLAGGDNVICTIENDDVAPSLTLNKIVTNDSGGKAAESAWTLNAVGSSQSPTNLSGSGAVGNADVVSGSNFKADTYTLSETGGPSGYSASAWTCTNGVTVNGNNQITLSNGQTTVCTITNNDIAPTLTLRKVVVNPYGGTGIATADLWTLKAQHESDNPLISMMGTLNNDNSASTTSATAIADTAYDLSESGPSGYMPGAWTCTDGGTVTEDQVTLELGKDVTCTIINTQLPASISGYKYEVDKDATAGDGTGTQLKDWTIYLLVSGSPILSTTTGTIGTDGYFEFTDLAWGTYSLAECLNVSDGCDSWTPIYYPTSDITVNGDNLTSSSIANDFGNFENGSIDGYKFNDLNGNGDDDIEPRLENWTFELKLDTDEDMMFSDESVLSTDDTNISGEFEFTNLEPGYYQVCEVQQDGWERTLPKTSDCRTTTIDQSGESASGLAFGNQGRGTIKVVKDVVNDNGGDKSYQDFSFDLSSNDQFDPSVDVTGNYDFQQEGADPDDGAETVMQVPAGTYNVSEPEANTMGYSTSYDNNCTNIVVTAGQIVTCTITNDDIVPELTVIKHVDNNGTTLTKTASDFTINVSGTNVSNPSFPGSEVGVDVTLDAGDYEVTENVDTDYDVTYSADCTGSINVGDSKTCTVTNTAKRGPAINVVKDGPATAKNGQTITYTFTVTNPGNVPLSGVTVSDDVAGNGAVLQSGDVDTDMLLDPGETWVYTVDYVVPANQSGSIVNTVTACGEGSSATLPTGLPLVPEDVCDTDMHTTRIFKPQVLGDSTVLPDTGQNPLVNVMAGAMLILLAVGSRWVGRKSQNAAL